MKERPWYKHYAADFLNGVDGIGPDTIGCYIVILDMLYDRGEPVPNDARLIGGRLGCSSRLARTLIDRLIGLGKLFQAPLGLTNIRAEKEITITKLNRLKFVESGSKGGRNRAKRMGETLHSNDLAQGGLKAGSSIRAGYQIKKDTPFLVQSSTPREEKKEAAGVEQAKPPEPLAASSALLNSRLMRKAS
jgi:uncharacterized protein YdaU (DUF1376 family)